jgi:imidazoleglycerol-phosphate dehydratase/histidinol-phosphatase
MDETLAQVAIDLSDRPYCKLQLNLKQEKIGGLTTELVPHFFRSLSDSLGASIHMTVEGENDHHKIEAVFKALGRSLRQAIKRDGFDLPSTKGTL